MIENDILKIRVQLLKIISILDKASIQKNFNKQVLFL